MSGDRFDEISRLSQLAIQRRSHPGHQLGWGCWCCQDTGIITTGNAAKYYQEFGNPNRDSFGMTLSEQARLADVSSAPIVCKNCSAHTLADGYADNRATPSECRAIHNAEVQAAREAAANPQPVQPPEIIRKLPKGNIYRGIAENMGYELAEVPDAKP